MNPRKYKSVVAALVFAIVALVVYAATQNSILTAVAALITAILLLHLLGKGSAEVKYDERTVLIRGKAASATLSIITVSMAIIGLSLVFLSGQGIGNYEQIGYLLAYQAMAILVLNALLSYYYRKRLGG